MALTRPKYSQIYDTDWKQSVELATTADVGNLVLANVQPNSIDGITVQTNYRILVKDQDSGAQNGIYLVRNAGTGSNGWWSRSLDALTSDRVTAGLAVNVVSGSINGGKEFKLTTPDPITLGTTVLTFIDPNAAAGAGGANAQVQFNDASVLNGSAGFTFNKFSNAVSISGSISGNTIVASGLTANTITTVLTRGADNSFQLTAQNGVGQNLLSTEVARFGINYGGTLGATGTGWDSFTQYIRGSSSQNGYMSLWASNTRIANVTSTGLAVSGNVSATYFTGNGALLTGIVAGSSYSNVQVATYLPTYTGNVGKIYYDPNNGFVGFNDTSPDFVYDFYTPDNAGEILHIEGGVGTQAFFGARNSSGLNYAAGTDQDYAFSGTIDTTNDYALKTNNIVRANIQGSSGNVIFTESITVAKDLLATTLGIQEIRGTAGNITVRSNITLLGTNLIGAGQLVIGTENLGEEALFVTGGATYFDGDVTVTGNLFVNGNVTYINSNNVNISDSMIYLAEDNPADTLDIGFVSAFTDSVRYQHTGFVRDATDGVWKLFANVVAEPTTSVDFTDASYANLRVGNITAAGATITGFSNIRIVSGSADSALQIVGNVSRGGASYHDFLRVTSTASGATNPNKNFRLDGTGNLQIINSAYSSVLLNLTDSGQLLIGSSLASTSTTTGALVVTGGVGVGGNLFVGGALTESSSATLKENITPIDGALDLILQLTGVVYDRRDGSRKNEAGLIAEEVNKVLPNLITLDDQGIPLGVQYTKLTAYLIEAVKSLKAEIDQLKKRD